MFDSDKWIEIFATMAKNPLRTFLTGLSVGIGVFILVVFQGLGFGLQNGAMTELQDDAINSIWIRKGRTSMPYAGLKPNRQIQFKNDDLEFVLEEYEGTNVYSGRLGFWGSTISYGSESQSFGVRCIHPGHLELERSDMTGGRYINEYDVSQERKVAVIGQTVLEDVFKGRPSVGEFITVRGIQFKVVGTYNDPNSRWENRQVLLPVSTGQKLFNANDRLDMFMVTTGDKPFDETVEMAGEIQALLREKHKVHPEDERALYVNNINEDMKQFTDIFFGIKIFICVVGILTLIAGMIGVANIMAVVVAERTREIGVRKAIGASPGSIISMIIQEAVLLTSISGILGFVIGWGVLQIGSRMIEHEFFKNPQVNLNVCLSVITILVFVGAIAGFFPAVRAANIKPIEALREE